MKKFFIIVIATICFCTSCDNKDQQKSNSQNDLLLINTEHSKSNIQSYADTLRAVDLIDFQLENYKITLFYYCLEEACKQSGVKMDGEFFKNDLTPTVAFQNSEIHTGALKFVFADLRGEAIVNNWVKKDYMKMFETSIGDANVNGKGHLNVLKALDFYKSDVLNKYIDSLRVSKYKEYGITSKFRK